MIMLNQFDIVIGNPPYVQIQKFSGKKEQKEWESQKYETFAKTGDIYSLFYEKGNMILKEKGLLCFITSNKWMRAGYGESTRKYFSEKTNPLLLVDFGGYKVFESATVDTNILIFEKTKNKNKTIACSIQKDFNEKININEYINKNSVILNELNSEGWIILSKKEFDIKKKIEASGTPLKDWDISINYGIKTGFNEAFIIDGKKKDELIEADPKNAEIIKPTFRGRDIQRYKDYFSDLWIIFISWHFPLHNDSSIQGNSLKAEEEFKIQYPYIYSHLENYKKELSARNKAETNINYEWYALQRCAATYYKEFEKEKIVWAETIKIYSDGIRNFPRFTFLSQKSQYLDKTCFMITSKNDQVKLKYILAVLNSKLLEFLILNLVITLGSGSLGLQKAFIENIPIPKISEEKQISFIEIVDKIMEKKKLGENTQELEDKIDIMVYKLYDLTIDEIKIIDSDFKK